MIALSDFSTKESGAECIISVRIYMAHREHRISSSFFFCNGGGGDSDDGQYICDTG